MALITGNLFAEQIKTLSKMIVNGFLNLYTGSKFYVSAATPDGDTSSDWRFSFVDIGSGYELRLERCTSANVSKGAGVWTNYFTISSNGFTKLGELATGVKMKVLTGTSNAAQNASVTIAHGLTSTKITSITCLVGNDASNYFPPEFSVLAGYQYSLYFGMTNVTIYNSTANSANILSKPITITIYYKE